MEKAFIFDMDGVVINSEPMHEQIELEVAAGFNIHIDQARMKKYVGMRSKDVWAAIIKEDGLDLKPEQIIEVADKQKVKYIEDNKLEPIDGIRELLVKLKELNYRIALASSSPKEFIEAVLKKFEILHFFDTIVNGDEVAHGKPAPDIFLEAARRLGVRPENCTILEDSNNGVDAGNIAGMRTIAYVNPDSGNLDLSKATHIVKSVRDVLSFV